MDDEIEPVSACSRTAESQPAVLQTAVLEEIVTACIRGAIPEIVSQVQARLHSPISSAAHAAAHAQAQHIVAQVGQNVVNQAAAVAQQQAAAVAQQTAQHVAYEAARQAPLHTFVMRDVLKHLRPPKFSGDNKKGEQRWDEFIYQANSYFTSLDDPTRMVAMSQMLTGDASLFWRTKIEGHAYGYADAFRITSRPVVYKGSVAAVVTQIDRLCLHIPNIADSEKKERLMAVLPKEILVALAVQTADVETLTYDDLCTKAERIDHAINSASVVHKSAGGTSSSGSEPMEVNALNPSRFVPKKTKEESKPQHKTEDKSPAPKLKKLTPEEKEDLKAKGLCYRCRVGKHMAKECPMAQKNSK
ncbi:hypothetical protein PLESTB_000202300 [Pleodorina starrii]|uniref:CCHC-type domain-containing protein n=1 Tax=Pleodorina starrii TaxID=330485 RepID=A0A9W6BCM2_9CHLO|nr:hypothetical protein PLESTB_000202300 [Pleodorina starrii]